MKTTLTSFSLLTLALVSLVLSSCVPSTGSSLRSRDSSGVSAGSSNVAVGQGRVLSDNPIILSKNANLSDSYDLNKLLTTVPITSDFFLKGNTSCSGLDYCFEVRENKDSNAALQSSNGKWAFNATSPEFLQVNTFYHLNKVIGMFYNNLTQSYNRAFNAFAFPTTPTYDTSLPPGLMISSTVFKGMSKPLIAYANCQEGDNAYFRSDRINPENTTFDPANMTLCFGYLSGNNSVRMAQDSSVIYHESGHFFQKLQLNFRNYANPQKVDLGTGFYDEAGSIGEGLADYYSYYVNGRTHFGEWSIGRFLNQSRPITEDDSLHASGITSDPDQRLSYPDYIGYDPNRPTTPVVDVHTSGMIVSHYLVALTEDLQTKCGFTKKDSSELIVHLLSETLAELGDLSTKGTEKNLTGLSKVNMNTSKSFDWVSKVNPINYRSFMQTFAKNILNNLGDTSLNRCGGSIYTKDQIESLIDQYGLLLFRTYNENRNLSVPGSVNNTTVNGLNRKKSVMVSKNLLILDPTVNASTAFIIDDRAKIREGITSLQANGIISSSLSPQTESDLSFNNDNKKVSPGEVVALVLNLYNNSNSPMAGVQILANDWNHADATGKPCQFSSTLSNDQWPLTSEGGVPCTSINAAASTDFAPVCFIQSNEASATKWVSQKDFKTKMALDSTFCLDKNNEKDCFIRAIKGADQANFSKLNSKSTWSQTFADPTSGAAPSFDWGNVILFEVSKHIPPGTVIDCRLRLRFTNCEDCYHDSTRSNYDYLDKDYNGPRPYKVIHLQIPIVD